MPISKIGNMKLETSAYLTALGNTNIVVWNMDIKTAILRFQVTRNKVVLPLGKNNVQAYITLFATDGSNITDNLVIEDEINGVVSYTIPKEFLAHTGTVHGQVYISVNGTEETVTEADFTFEIKDALINKIPSETKISYIRIFDDLKTEIENRVQAIEEAIANGQDYVTAIQNARDEAKQAIDDKVAAAKTDIDGKIKTATDNLNKTATDTTKAITDKANAVDNEVKAASGEMQTLRDEIKKTGFVNKAGDTMNGDLNNLGKYTLQYGYLKHYIGQQEPGTTIRIQVGTKTEWFDYLDVVVGETEIKRSGDLIVFPIPNNQTTSLTGIAPVTMTQSKSTINGTDRIGGGTITKTTALEIKRENKQVVLEAPESIQIKATSLTFNEKELETVTGSKEKVAALIALLPVGETGGVKKSFTSDTDLIESVKALDMGTHTFYAPTGTTNSPSSRAVRGWIVKTSKTIGYVWATDDKANFYSGYCQADGSFIGWKAYGTNSETILFQGAANGVGTKIKLTQSYTSFDALKVSYLFTGSSVQEKTTSDYPIDRKPLASILQITDFNVVDADGAGGGLYECQLTANNVTELQIANDVLFDIKSGNGSGANANKYTITRVIGVTNG